MFTIGDGSQSNNAWNMPDGYTDRFMRLLPVFDLRVLTTSGNWLIVEPIHYGHPRYHKWFLITDNGGELLVGEINSEERHVSIPYSATTRGIVNAATVVNRMASAIAGRNIDWTFELSEDEEDSLLRVLATE